MLFLFCVTSWFILPALHVLKSSRALCPRVSSFLFSIVMTSLGEKGVGLCASRAFCVLVCMCVSFCPFLFVSGVGCGL